MYLLSSTVCIVVLVVVRSSHVFKKCLFIDLSLSRFLSSKHTPAIHRQVNLRFIMQGWLPAVVYSTESHAIPTLVPWTGVATIAQRRVQAHPHVGRVRAASAQKRPGIVGGIAAQPRRLHLKGNFIVSSKNESFIQLSGLWLLFLKTPTPRTACSSTSCDNSCSVSAKLLSKNVGESTMS